MTRSYYFFAGIWDFMTGKLLFKLANAALGAIVTHALVNKDGTYIVAAESGLQLFINSFQGSTREEWKFSSGFEIFVNIFFWPGMV